MKVLALLCLVFYAIDLSASFIFPPITRFPKFPQHDFFSHYPQSTQFQRRVSVSEFRELAERARLLEQYLNLLQLNLNDCLEDVANLIPKCPALAVGAAIIGNKCYSVEVSPKTFVDAKAECFRKGGILAEPSYHDTNFYVNLQAAFPSTFSQAGPGGLFVNVVPMVGAAPIQYIYGSNNVPIPNTSPPWNVAIIATTPAATSAGALVPFGTGWAFTEVLLATGAAATVTRPFLCEYPTITTRP